MYFFKNTTGNWVLGSETTSFTSKIPCTLRRDTPTVVTIMTIEKIPVLLIDKTEVTTIKKNEAGDFYASYAEFLTAVSDFFDNAPITAEEVDAKIGAEVDTLSDKIDTVEGIANASAGGSLGPIKPTDAAPTPQRNGNYTFSIGGNKPAWLTAEAGITEVKAGDGVSVVYDGVSAYTYTHVAIMENEITKRKFLAAIYSTNGINGSAKLLNMTISDNTGVLQASTTHFVLVGIATKIIHFSTYAHNQVHFYDNAFNYLGYKAANVGVEIENTYEAAYYATSVLNSNSIVKVIPEVSFISENLESLDTLHSIIGIKGIVQKGTVTIGASSGSNTYFTNFGELPTTKRIAFYLRCDSGVINKYALITNTGIDVEGTLVYYKFLPNQWYYVFVSPSFFTGASFGAFINTVNAIGNGAFEFVLMTDYEGGVFQASQQKNFMMSKEFYSLCDSLGTAEVCQNKLAVLTGAIFDNTKNTDVTKPLSIGGTATLTNQKNCGQWRAKNLVANYPSAKIVFFENINDMNETIGVITDKPFMLKRIDDIADQGLSDLAAANNYWITNFATIVAGYTPIKGAVINIPYYGTGKNLKIIGLPTSNGNVSLVVAGKTYSIAVTTADTIQTLLVKILEYQYELVSDAANADGLSVDFYYAAGVTVTFNANGTGMTVAITDTTTAQVFTPRYFIGEANTTDWNSTAKWSSTRPTLYSAMRGFVEYLQSNLPTAELIWVIPTRFATTYTSYLRADGTKDIDAYLAADVTYQNLCAAQKAICDLYNLRYVDINKKGGINLNNFASFYYENNVHPKTECYEKWGETIYKMLIG